MKKIFLKEGSVSVRYIDEARDWLGWLLRAVAGNPEQAHILYGIAGERLLPEIELDWLPGYENSRPVRIGNAAARNQVTMNPTLSSMPNVSLAARSTILGCRQI